MICLMNHDRNGCLWQDKPANDEAAAVRQMGRSAVQGFFPTLKEKNVCRVISICRKRRENINIRLFGITANFRRPEVGQNQITNNYMPFLNRNALE